MGLDLELEIVAVEVASWNGDLHVGGLEAPLSADESLDMDLFLPILAELVLGGSLVNPHSADRRVSLWIRSFLDAIRRT